VHHHPFLCCSLWFASPHEMDLFIPTIFSYLRWNVSRALHHAPTVSSKSVSEQYLETQIRFTGVWYVNGRCLFPQGLPYLQWTPFLIHLFSSESANRTYCTYNRVDNREVSGGCEASRRQPAPPWTRQWPGMLRPSHVWGHFPWTERQLQGSSRA
jgi:hypothetical protein